MNSNTDVTLETYQHGVQAYLASAPLQVTGAARDLLDALGTRLPTGHVLELGSGPGLEADYLEGRGLTVRRTDATPAFVERLQRLGHRAELLDVRTDPFGGPYDAVLANAVLLHLDRDAFARALGACRQATRPHGYLALTLKEGAGEGWSRAKLGQPRWFVYWQEAALRQALEQAGWTVEMLEHIAGRTEPWLHVVCRRPS